MIYREQRKQIREKYQTYDQHHSTLINIDDDLHDLKTSYDPVAVSLAT